MTTPTYPEGPSPVTLFDRFENLKRDGWTPSEAIEVLSLMHMGEHFHTPFRSLNLGFRLGPNDSLIVDSSEGEIDPRKVPTRDPDKLFDPAPVPFDIPVSFDSGPVMEERAKLLEAARVSGKPRTLEQYLVEDPGALKSSKEIEATRWLAPKLTPDDEGTRETHRDDCMGKFDLSEVGYRERVWYAARYLAGLPRERKSGAPKGPRKAGTPKRSRKKASR
jgi:hypothetical protein